MFRWYLRALARSKITPKRATNADCKEYAAAMTSSLHGLMAVKVITLSGKEILKFESILRIVYYKKKLQQRRKMSI